MTKELTDALRRALASQRKVLGASPRPASLPSPSEETARREGEKQEG